MSFPKTIAILGAAYGGTRAAQVLAKELPKGWRIVLIDRNTHMNHVYILPRLAVLEGHEHKAFVPYTNVFNMNGPQGARDPPAPSEPHTFLHASVESLSTRSLVLSKAFPEHGVPADTRTLDFEYVIYALGSALPGPLDLWGPSPGAQSRTPYNGEKTQSVDWIKQQVKTIEQAGSVLIVGGGALGIQFASDIAAVHPTKKVTLLHSRDRVMPKYDESVHDQIVEALKEANVDVILGERLDLESTREQPAKRNEQGQRVVRTVSGREIASDLLLLCTGQRPNTSILRDLNPCTLTADGTAHVLRTMQLSVVPPAPIAKAELEHALEMVTLEEPTHAPAELEKATYPTIFVVGDAADAFGAIKAGHTAYYQGEVAAKNIMRLIAAAEGEEKEELLEEYTPGLPAIKVTLGLKKYVYEVGGKVGSGEDGVDDLHAIQTWTYYGLKVDGDEDMHA